MLAIGFPIPFSDSALAMPAAEHIILAQLAAAIAVIMHEITMTVVDRFHQQTSLWREPAGRQIDCELRIASEGADAGVFDAPAIAD